VSDAHRRSGVSITAATSDAAPRDVLAIDATGIGFSEIVRPSFDEFRQQTAVLTR
jgi:hypothetical protein